MASSRERLALAWLCSSVAETTVATSATPDASASLTPRSLSASATPCAPGKRRDGADDLAHIGELREGFRGQERADLEMPHAGAVFVADPALLRRRRWKCLHQLQAVAQADFAQTHLVVGINVLNAGHASLTAGLAVGRKFLRRLKLGANRFGVGAERRHFQPLADTGAVPFHRKRRNAERRAIGIDIIDEAAGPQHMRIAEQILGTVDRREADVQPVEFRGKLRRVPALDHLGDARNDPATAP